VLPFAIDFFNCPTLALEQITRRIKVTGVGVQHLAALVALKNDVAFLTIQHDQIVLSMVKLAWRIARVTLWPWRMII
jgi:hypothetical protein